MVSFNSQILLSAGHVFQAQYYSGLNVLSFIAPFVLPMSLFDSLCFQIPY